MSKEIIVTLFENDYHFGVAALINSLVASGFKGLLIAGYRGNLPPWEIQLEKVDEVQYRIAEGFFLKFEFLNVGMHFGYFKPDFILKIFNDYSGVEKVFYFDPDIVVISPWSFFNSWVDIGVALCLDNSFPFVHHNHPWREEWRKMLLSIGDGNLVNEVDYYINSGFVGIMRHDLVLMEKWKFLTTNYKNIGGDVTRFEKEGNRAYKGDQDLLNAAITACPEARLSVIGSEGMGFSYPHYLMLHAVETIKPWRANFLKNVIKTGSRPSPAAKGYFNNCYYPINIYSSKTLKIKQYNLKIASAIGRIIGK